MIKGIDCVINQEYTIDCRREGNEVFLPFSFIKKYFEVYGSLSSDADEITHFVWSHSYGKINLPRATYDSKGVFAYFENYNVEIRDRVKCISARLGVPLSTQWNSYGYYYATQIAQFGLAHYSKNLTEPEPTKKIIEDGEDYQSTWINNSSFIRSFTMDYSVVANFETANELEKAVYLQITQTNLDLILSVDLLLRDNSSLIITMQNRESQEDYYLHYTVADFSIKVNNSNIYYGIGSSAADRWKHLVRDLFIDLVKGVVTLYSHRKFRRTEVKIIKIAFLGVGAFDNLTLSTSEHIQHFYDAADFFILHQNLTTGGFGIPVKRKLAKGFNDLNKGWLRCVHYRINV